MAVFHHKVHYAERNFIRSLHNNRTLLENVLQNVIAPETWIMGISYRSFMLKPLLKLAMYRALLS